MLGTKEIAEILGVKAVTVRKYAGALEKAGYIVGRGESGHREYTQNDATVFRELQALCERSGMTVNMSAQAVVSRVMKERGSVSHGVVPVNNSTEIQYAERYNELMTFMQGISEHNQNQAELLAKQAEEIDRLHKRMDQQNNNISVMLREVLDTRRMVAAANDKKWYQFWKKRTVLPDLDDPETVWKMKRE